MARATSICPAWPRSACRAGSSGAVEPMIASVERQDAATAASMLRMASKYPASAQAVENCVPLMSPSPSFGPRMTGASPARSSATRAGSRTPLETGLALADQGGRHMRQRREIAGGADGSLHGNDGCHPAREAVLDQLRRFPADTRCAAAQRQKLEDHHQAASSRRRARRPRRSNATGRGSFAAARYPRAAPAPRPACRSLC